jgi:hypothetical protein
MEASRKTPISARPQAEFQGASLGEMNALRRLIFPRNGQDGCCEHPSSKIWRGYREVSRA